MKTEQITVTSKGLGMNEALALTEKLAQGAELDKKPVLHLRLLAEELFGMLRGIAGEVKAAYWVETEEKKFELHLKAEVNMTEDMREQFLKASSSGKNAAAASFMGKIRVMIADMLLSTEEVLPYAMMNTVASFPMSAAAGETAAIWTMSAYKDDVSMRRQDDKAASEAWDELEKSIVANIADDIKVSIVGKNVEIVVYKAF